MRTTSFLICWVFLLCRVWCDSSHCGCQSQPSIFDTKYRDSVNDNCKKCFTFEYSYFIEQNWTARVCVTNLKPAPTPLLVTARQSVSSISFEVPWTIEGERTEYQKVCRTLCPISNHYGTAFMNGTQQKIALDFWSKLKTDFEFEVQILYNFIIGTNTPITLNLTVSEPAVLQYNIPEELNSARIQANSDTRECMILSAEDIKCPFHDTTRNIHHGGYRLTQTKKSSLIVKRDHFRGQLYIVMLLDPHPEDCMMTGGDTNKSISSKEVTVEVTPVYRLSSAGYELWVPPLAILILGILCAFWYHLFCAVEPINQHEEQVPFVEHAQAPPDDEETAYRNKYYVMSDMIVNNESSKSYTYCWNLGAVSIFYALPAIQLVYLSHHLMYKTGNRDECYYNFQCSHPMKIASWLEISDFNHVWSNIGYMILGITFMVIVRIQESRDPYSQRNVNKRRTQVEQEQEGIPPHYGMFYALGLSLFMEGFMSATYHICPKGTNFQFDTTFMYVICTLCIMKLFYGRHQAIAPKAHSFWMMLAISVFIPFIEIISEVLFWLLSIAWIFTILYVTICYVIIPRKLEFVACEGIYCSYLSRLPELLPKEILEGRKSFVHPRFRIGFVAIGWLVVIITTSVFNHQDSNSVLLFFYIINVGWYTTFYIVVKIAQGKAQSEPEMFQERISYHSVAFTALGALFMAIAVLGFFIKGNVEWSETPALSREKNRNCYGGFNYYDKHDVWHYLSSIGLFFHFLFLLSVDNDLKKKPVSQIVIF